MHAFMHTTLRAALPSKADPVACHADRGGDAFVDAVLMDPWFGFLAFLLPPCVACVECADTRVDAWICADACGYAALTYADTRGYAPTHADTRGYAPTHADTRGYAPTHVDTRGYALTYADTRGYAPTYADTRGYAPTHADTRGYAPTHVDTRGYAR